MRLSKNIYYYSSYLFPAITAFFVAPFLLKSVGPDNFGRYSFVITVAGIIGTLLFEWQRIALLRDFSGKFTTIQINRSTDFFIFLMKRLVVVLLLVGICVSLFRGLGYLYFVPVIALLQGSYDHSLAFYRAANMHREFFGAVLARFVLFMVLSIGSLSIVSSYHLLLTSLSLTLLFPSLIFFYRYFKSKLLTKSYFLGEPNAPDGWFSLTLVAAQNYLTSAIPKVIVGVFLSKEILGPYSVLQDSIVQSVFAVMMVINIVSFTEFSRLYNRGEEKQAIEYHLKRFSIAFSLCLLLSGTILLFSNIFIPLLLGTSKLRHSNIIVIFMFANSILLSIKIYLIDPLFTVIRENKIQSKMAVLQLCLTILFCGIGASRSEIGVVIGATVATICVLILSIFAAKRSVMTIFRDASTK